MVFGNVCTQKTLAQKWLVSEAHVSRLLNFKLKPREKPTRKPDISLGITCPTEGYFNLKTEKVKIFGFHPKPSKYQSGVPRQKFLTSRQILAIFSRFDKNFFLGTPYQRYDFLGNFLLFFRSFTYLAHLSFSFKF